MKEHRRAGDMNISVFAEHEQEETKACDRWHVKCPRESWHMMNYPNHMNREKEISMSITLSYLKLMTYTVFIKLDLYLFIII